MARRLSIRSKSGIVGLAVCVLVLGSSSLWADGAAKTRVQRYTLTDGTLALHLDPAVLASLGFSLVPQGQLDADESGASILLEIDVATSTKVATSDGVLERFDGAVINSCGALLVDRPGERIVIGNLALSADDNGVYRLKSTLDPRQTDQTVFELFSAFTYLNRAGYRLSIEGELAIAEAWANELGLPDAAGTVVGVVEIEASVEAQRRGDANCGESAVRCLSQDGKGSTATIGSDIVVADLQSVLRYVTSGDTSSFAIATLACNLGTERASWISHTNQHPVIVQNLFRLMDDRFEQIGMAWVKHGFYAVSDSFCTPCLDLTNGTELGVGCSDPYSASLNGVQSNMSPRSLVNAHTGYFPYPWSGPSAHGQERRLLVSNSDLNPTTNPGARYFMEGHYVHPDDCLAGTQDNNASYREVLVNNISAGQYGLVINQSWSTQRGQAGIRAWHDADPEVVEREMRVPGEGLFILAVKVTPTETGLWKYRYALQNLNSDRSGRSFSLQLPSGAILTNIGFHDVAYHSGEPIASDPWSVTVTDESITWSTTTYEADPNANALRFDTIYNFYFDANIEPGVNKSTIGLFKPGSPKEVAGSTIGPKLDVIDCNHNGTPDACDISCISGGCQLPCGASIDCNNNGVPDECESDCNGNGIADSCDISNCPFGDLACSDCNSNEVPDGCEVDCDGDGIPDDCDTPEDTDGDGIADCFDLCPDTTPIGACDCPPLGTCCYPVGICIPDYPRYACIEQGGTPDCVEAPCRMGCLIGDFDRDGNRDLPDFQMYQVCFSGPAEEGSFVLPTEECVTFLDFDGDNDIDAADYARFEELCTGP